MEVRFRSSGLRRAYKKQAVGVRLWGSGVAKRYVNRIDIIQASETTGDLRKIPQLLFHELKGTRKRQYALTLIGRWRLIVSVNETAKEVTIEEVSNHYGD